MYRTEPKEKAGVSKSLLQALAQLKEDEMTSKSLIAALDGTAMEESVSFEDQFKLPDLVSTEGGEQTSQQEKRAFEAHAAGLSVGLENTSVCILTKKRLKLELQYRERSREKGQRMHYSQKVTSKMSLTQEEVEEKIHKEQLKKE